MSAARHPADRGGDGLLHGRRRLRAGDERRDGDRAGHGHDLPRRPAAGEGGDRRGGDRRGARRRRRPRPAVGRGRHYAEDDEHALAHRARDVGARCKPAATRCPWAPCCSRERAAPTTPAELYGIVPADPAHAVTTSARSSRAWSTASGSTSSRRSTATTLVCGFARIWGYPVGDPGQQRRPVHRVRAEGRALHRAVLPAPDPAGVPAEHHRLHGRPRVRERRHRQGRRQDGDGRGLRRRCPSSRSSSAARSAPATTACAAGPTAPRQLWMWPNARISRDGRRAGGRACCSPSAAMAAGPGPDVDTEEEAFGARSWRSTRRGERLLLHGAAVGRRCHRSRGHAPDARPRSGGSHPRADPRAAIRRLPHVSPWP